ncbi:MAG: hypothetical protein ACI8Z1_001278 [Candidatus Azotimanducaceae bacterium]
MDNAVLTKRETLKAMGIEVWAERSTIVVADVVTDSALEAKSESDPNAQANVQTGASQASLDTLKATVARREETTSGGALVVNNTESSIASESAISTVQVTLSFRYALLHYGAVGLCVSLPLSASAQASDLPRRLCDDIAGLLGGDIKAARFQELKWPMVQSSGIDQSLPVAKQVVTDKFRQLPAKVVVIGRDVGRCFQLIDDLDPFTHGNFGGQQFLMVPSLTELMSSAEQKKTLMMALLAWR